MPASPVEAEATGQSHVTVEFGGRGWTIPVDVDDWPLVAVQGCISLDRDQRIVVNHRTLILTLQLLLGEQWQDFVTHSAPRRGDLVKASQAFATAVGIEANPKNLMDVVFGAIPRLLLELQHFPAAIEATLADMGEDYRDRWRFQAGRRLLTLRRIHVRLSHAPYDCALTIARRDGKRPHSPEQLALMDVYEGITHQPHHLRPMSVEERSERVTADDQRQKHVADYKSRRANPADTARQNAQIGRH